MNDFVNMRLLRQVLHEKSAESQLVGQISIPAKPGQGNVIPIHVGLQQLQDIHKKFTAQERSHVSYDTVTSR